MDIAIIMKECKHPDCTIEFAAHIDDDYCSKHWARTPDSESARGSDEDSD